MRGRLVGAGRVGVMVLVLAIGVTGAVVWALFLRSPERHDIDGLSCTSNTFSRSAVDFAGIPSWPNPRAALDYGLELDKTIPSDGWRLTVEGDVATWERHDGEGHLVGRSIHHRVGSEWGFGLPLVCEETRLDTGE